jgi:hypothetical protein
MDNVMMKAAAITNLFPQIGELFISSKLKRLSAKQLQALTYLFEIPKKRKYLLKSKEGKLELLTGGYYKIATMTEFYDDIDPFIIKIYEGLQFSVLNPRPEPNVRLLQECATIAYRELFDENPSAYFQISSWIAVKMEAYFREYMLYMQSQELKPHRFDICCEFEEKNTPFEPFDCPICQEEINEKSNCVETNCKHKYCGTCIDLQIRTSSTKREKVHPTCALCRTPINKLNFKSYDIGESIHNKYISEDRLFVTIIDL